MSGSQIVLLSNKSSTRWVIPKGHLEDSDSGTRERAGLEAWEEGGIRGNVSDDPIGSFFYSKKNKVYRVEVFFMPDVNLAEDWPERSLRTRVLVDQERAVEMVREPGLKELIGRLPLQ